MPYHVVEYRESSRRPFGVPTRASAARSVGFYSGKVHNRIIPRVAHQRIVTVPPPSRNFQLQDPYADGSRYALSPIPYNVKVVQRIPSSYSKVVRIEDLDSSSEMDEFEAETRCIRRDANNLLFRHMAHGYGMPLPLYAMHNIPLRNAGEAKQVVDVRRRWVRERNNMGPMSKIHSEIYRMAMYQEPMRRHIGGRGTNLACISFAGGRPISKRQLRFYPEDDRIRDDISFRSFYNSLRVAASLGMMYKKPLYQPLYRSKKSIMGAIEPEKKEEKKTESKWVQRAFSREETVPESKSIPVKRQVSEEIREDIVVPGPRKSIVELERQTTIEEYVEEKPVVVKMPKKKSIEIPEPAYEEPAITEETVKLASPSNKEETEAVIEAEPIAEEVLAPTEAEPIPEEVPAPPEPEPVEVPATPEPAKEPTPEPEPVREETPVAPTPEPEPVKEDIPLTPEPEPLNEEIVPPPESEEIAEEVPPTPESAKEEENIPVVEATEDICEPEVLTVSEPEISETPVPEEPETPLVNGAVEEEHITTAATEDEVVGKDNDAEEEAEPVISNNQDVNGDAAELEEEDKAQG